MEGRGSHSGQREDEQSVWNGHEQEMVCVQGSGAEKSYVDNVYKVEVHSDFMGESTEVYYRVILKTVFKVSVMFQWVMLACHQA